MKLTQIQVENISLNRLYTVEKLEKISQQTNRSRNELINIMLEFGIQNCEIKE